MSQHDIGANLKTVHERVARAARQADRDPEDICMIAVSKMFPAERIESAIAAGQRVFGENRVQEAQGKWPALRTAHPGLELHLLGPLQTNKAAAAVAMFDVIHSLDREKLARKLADVIAETGHSPRLYVQVNTGEEKQKAGVTPGDADDFIAFCRDEAQLNIAGLMCIPPADEPPGLHFALLRQIAVRNGLHHLSMGMSGDFESAVRFGATHIRLGTAVFGPRPATVKPAAA